MKMTLKTQISPIFKRTLSYVNPKKLPCFYATNNQRSLECDLTSKNSFLMPPISKYFLIQPNWFPLLELIKKKIAILGTAALPVHGDISLWYCCYNFLNYIKQAFRRKFFNCTYLSFTWFKLRDIVPEIIDSGPICITDLFQNNYLAYLNSK